MFKQSQFTSSYDITDIGHIERLVIGTTSPDRIPTEEESQQKVQLLNKYLQTSPRGRIIGCERSFALVRIGEHQVVLEAVAYHVGFKRKPAWLSGSNIGSAKPFKPQVDLDAVDRIIEDNC